jgi:hypothetical protein
VLSEALGRAGLEVLPPIKDAKGTANLGAACAISSGNLKAAGSGAIGLAAREQSPRTDVFATAAPGGPMSQDADRVDRAECWRALAAEAAAAAQETRDPEPKRLLMFIAAAYDRLAQRARGPQNRSR